MGNQCNTCQTKTTREGDNKVNYNAPQKQNKYNKKTTSKRTDSKRSSDSSSYGGSQSTASMDDFRKIKVVGRGAYGKVYLVQHNFTDKIFAMKAVKKELVIKTDQLEGIKCKFLFLF